jgi:hypothetical protein
MLKHVQKLSGPAKVKATSTGKLHNSLPRNDAVAELCCAKFNVINCGYPAIKVPTTPAQVFQLMFPKLMTVGLHSVNIAFLCLPFIKKSEFNI